LFSGQLSRIDANKIDRDYILSDEFYILFKKTLEKVRFEYQQEKIQLFKNFLIKSSLKNLSSTPLEIKKEYLLNKLETITLEHFLILEWYFKNNFMTRERLGVDFSVKKQSDLPNVTPLYEEYENDLVSLGFLHDDTAGRISPPVRYCFPSKLGKIFQEFIHYDDIE